MIDYSGDDITIEEMPSGCVINSKKGEVVVASPGDVIALRDSLNKFIETMIKEGSVCKICFRPMGGEHNKEIHNKIWDNQYWE